VTRAEMLTVTFRMPAELQLAKNCERAN
jgi:hypothetical protein